MDNDEYLNEERFRKLVLKLEPECVSTCIDEMLVEWATKFALENNPEILLSKSDLEPISKHGYNIDKIVSALRFRGFNVQKQIVGHVHYILLFTF